MNISWSSEKEKGGGKCPKSAKSGLSVHSGSPTFSEVSDVVDIGGKPIDEAVFVGQILGLKGGVFNGNNYNQGCCLVLKAKTLGPLGFI